MVGESRFDIRFKRLDRLGCNEGKRDLVHRSRQLRTFRVDRFGGSEGRPLRRIKRKTEEKLEWEESGLKHGAWNLRHRAGKFTTDRLASSLQPFYAPFRPAPTFFREIARQGTHKERNRLEAVE